MKFSIEYKDLQKIKNFLLFSNKSETSTDKKDNSFIFVECKANELSFFVTREYGDCNLIIENVKIAETGNIVVNSKIFLALIENLKNYQQIDFSKIENDILQIKSEKFVCNLICVEEQKNLQKEIVITEEYKKIIFNMEHLKIIDNRLKEFCKNLNNNINKNTILTNLNFKKNKGENEMNVFSTDSYRIIYAKFPQTIEEEFNLNISPVILSCIVNLFSEIIDTFDFFIFENNFVIKTKSLIFKSKLFIGKYPDLLNLFIIEPKIQFEINKKDLISALERNLFLSGIENSKNTFHKLCGNKLLIEYKDSEKGFTKEEIDVVNLKNLDIDFHLNSSYLKQLIKNIPSNELIFNMTESFKPIIIYGKNSDDNFKHFILPLKNN